MVKKAALLLVFALLTSALFYSVKYSLKYMHWIAKSNGYPDLYNQKDNYPFTPVSSVLKDAQWELIGTDIQNDGDIPGWPDLKELSFTEIDDTIWMQFSLHNNIDINEPMVSIAFEKENGNDWYGTVDFNYQGIISAGYYRNRDQYFGYNFSPEEKGICSFKYDLYLNNLFLGIPAELLKKYNDRSFVASVGYKGLWNDDIDSIIPVRRFIKKD